MPVYRDENGNIIEEPTAKVDSNQAPDPGYDQATRKVGGGGAQQAGGAAGGNYDAKTRVVGGGAENAGAASGGAYDQKTRIAGAAGSTSGPGSDAKTQIYRPGKKQAAAQPAEAAKQSSVASAPVQESAAMDDPPVGWLVIIKGAGKGNVLTIGNGANTIGRDAKERIRVDFGDSTISASHAVITYDPRGRKFYLQHGGGKNLTYLNESPVLAPTELTPNAHILVGDTLMRFSPLCGVEFDWADLEEE
jgi:hypothetical protein